MLWNFTFQYGSIQISKAEYVVMMEPPLHSNMVLFKFLSKHTPISNAILYIPIWFYSNASIRFLDSEPSGFTFQYGSIQIITYSFATSLNNSLHSNMVLFKWVGVAKKVLKNFSLHSNMVLFKLSPLLAISAFKFFTFQYGSIQIVSS